MIIVYKTGFLTYSIGKRILGITMIGLANILLGEIMFKEYIQHEATAENISEEALHILTEKEYRVKMIKKTELLKKTLFFNENKLIMKIIEIVKNTRRNKFV